MCDEHPGYLRRSMLLCILLLSIGPLATACDSDGCPRNAICDSFAPSLGATPNPLVFDAPNPGESSTRTLQIANTGAGTLIISSIELVDPSGDYAMANVDTSLELEAPDGPVLIDVTYAPQTTGFNTAYILIQSNDRVNPQTRVDLTPADIRPNITVVPDPVIFGRVPAGMVEAERVTIQNISQANLVITDIFVTGSADFTISDYDTLAAQLPITLEPFAPLLLDVEYAPVSDGFDEADLMFRSNDPDEPTKGVTLIANGAEPCIAVTHEQGYDFGPTRVGIPRSEQLTITSCADANRGQELVVSDIALVDTDEVSSSPDFELQVGDLLDDGEFSLLPGENAQFLVQYTPADESADVALIEILSNDEFKNPLHIDIDGIGSDNACPTAVATCRVAGSPVEADQITAPPLSTVQCTGLASSDTDGSIQSYHWTVTDRPDGSTATFEPNADTATPTFFIDLAGAYEFELEVVDDAGVISCNPAVVTVLVTGAEAIHVQLVWHTPAALAPQEDNGVDLDLHFLHPVGRWNDLMWDVHPGNLSPMWNGVSHPSMDIDDTNGAGPENVNLDDPQNDVWYRVGVHYNDAIGVADTLTYATTRIYVNGLLTFERAEKPLQRAASNGACDGDFWDVAAVHWPTGNISAIDTVYPDFNSSIPDSCPQTQP